MNLNFFNALPNYFGGKRKLANKIFKHAEGETFVDAFLGGGSLSLLAKALNYKVIANDIAERSYLVGNAFLENNEVTVSYEDSIALLEKVENEHFVEKNYAPNKITREMAQYLDNGFENVKKFECKELQSLLKIMMIKWIQSIRPFGQFSRDLPVELIESRNYDAVLRHKVWSAEAMDIFKPLENFEKIRKKVNSGVMDNGKENKVYKLDVFDFLKQVKGDTLYLDPPYAGATSYEQEYNLIDNFLNQKMSRPEHSIFNKEFALNFFDELLQASEHFPLWLISFNEKIVIGEELQSIVEKYRKCELLKFNFRYGISAQRGEEIKHSKEILLIGRGQ